MKRRITALVLVMVICFMFCGVAMARGALGCQAGVRNGYSYATLSSGSSEKLYVQFSLYKVEGNKEVFQTSASSSATGRSVTASSSKALSSGTYRMYIYGYGNTVTFDDTKTFVI